MTLVGLNSTMDNMDDHPSSFMGVEGVWIVIHVFSEGPWVVVLHCLKEVFH